MNSNSALVIRRSNKMSPSLATDDFMLFVLRSKASTLESADLYEDTFCIVYDSYKETINKNDNVPSPAFLQPVRKSSTADRFSRLNGYNVHFETAFNLELFRHYLTFFEVHPNSSISYMNNKNILCSVQTETEFLKLWRFAKSCAKRNKGVLLLIDFTNQQDDKMINCNNKVPNVNDQINLNIKNVNLSDNVQVNANTIEVNDTHLQNSYEQFKQCNDSDTSEPALNMTKSSSTILTKENNDTKLESTVSSNINNQDVVDKTPPVWLVHYMEQFKQDIIKEVSEQVITNVKKHLSKRPTKSLGHTRVKDTIQSENQVYNHRSKNNQDIKNHFMDHKRVLMNSRLKKEKKMEGKLEYNSDENNTKKKTDDQDKKYKMLEIKDNTNSIYESNDATTENEAVSNYNSTLFDFLDSQQSSKKHLYDPKLSNAKEGSEFRMNCSITEHQMLDKTNFTSKSCYCGCDTENISLSSDISDEDVSTECNFEMIPKPSKEDINKDLMSSYILPNIPLTPPVSICLDEDHFTASSNNISTSLRNSNSNIPSFCKSNNKEDSACDDTNTATNSPYPLSISNKCQDSDVSEIGKSISKLFLENSSAPADKITNTRPDCLDVKTDVNNSHTSYMTSKPINAVHSDSSATQCSCQAQTDLNDLTLSFHSHTTSIADNGVYCIRDTNTSTSHDYSKRNLSNSRKPTNSQENRTCEQIKKDTGNESPVKKMSKKKSNVKNAKYINEDTATNSTPTTAEPVHILPETLVTGALQFASFAYGTAREAIVKIRSNSKDDRRYRRRMFVQ